MADSVCLAGTAGTEVVLRVRCSGHTLLIHHAVDVFCRLAYYRSAEARCNEGRVLHLDQVLQFCPKLMFTEAIPAVDVEEVHCPVTHDFTCQGKNPH